MKILAIDTSTEYFSLALLNQQVIFQQCEYAPRRHAAIILPAVDALLTQHHLRLNEIDYFAFGAGPGSFTGLRIGASVIQALAYATSKKVVPVSTLQALAQGSFRQFKTKKCLAALDARMHEIYYGAYALDSCQVMQPLGEDAVKAPSSVVVPSLSGWVGVGNGWTVYQEQLVRLDEVHGECYPQAHDIATIARTKIEQGLFVDAKDALPVYLRNSVT